MIVNTVTAFPQSNAAGTTCILFTASFCVATIPGQRLQCLYFFWKPADINDSWIRYVQAIQWQLLDAIGSTRSLSVLLSAVETSGTVTIQTVLGLSCWPSSAVIRTGLLFKGGIYFAQNFRLYSYYSRAAFISLESPQTSTTGGKGTYERYSDDCLDAGSSTRNLSILLSAMEKSCTTRTAI